MKKLNAVTIIQPIAQKINHALQNVESKTCELISKARLKEENQLAKWALEQIEQNNTTAAEKNLYACQDCGQAVLFVELGTNLTIEGDLDAALNSAVEQGYTDARKSVADPITRFNTKTNTPAVIHYEINSGNNLKVTYLAKGAGSENMSAVYMLTPSKGEDGIINSVVDCVTKAGANPCPPIILGIGIGGTMEKCALLSKKALTAATGTPNNRKDLRLLEEKILMAVNKTGIGAQGFGGSNTALAVHVLTAPTHIGMLPVAVNIQCHSVRHFSIEF